uniref:Uncharacterized protein n=1 Tax=Trichuris muris TaxID=70415 RepID=A0A5S6Q7Y0_TRIMR
MVRPPSGAQLRMALQRCGSWAASFTAKCPERAARFPPTAPFHFSVPPSFDASQADSSVRTKMEQHRAVAALVGHGSISIANPLARRAARSLVRLDPFFVVPRSSGSPAGSRGRLNLRPKRAAPKKRRQKCQHTVGDSVATFDFQ